MGFPRQEYWSGLPFPSAGDLPDSGIKPVSRVSPALQADALPAEPSGKSLYIPIYKHIYTHTHTHTQEINKKGSCICSSGKSWKQVTVDHSKAQQ